MKENIRGFAMLHENLKKHILYIIFNVEYPAIWGNRFPPHFSLSFSLTISLDFYLTFISL